MSQLVYSTDYTQRGLGTIFRDALSMSKGLGDATDTFDPTDPTTWGASYDPVLASINIGNPAGGNSTIATTPGQGTSVWDSVLSGVKSASSILSTRYSVPQLNAGQYIQTSPYGSTMYQLPAGTTNGFTTPGSLSSLGSFLPILLIGGVLLFAMKGK